jgi:uncharacterized membrane protein
MDTFLSARAVLVSAAVGALVVAFLRRKTDDVHDVPGPVSVFLFVVLSDSDLIIFYRNLAQVKRQLALRSRIRNL